MIKIIKIQDKDGKISYTFEELEKLLNEVYDQGFADGKSAGGLVINSPSPSPLTPPWNGGPYYTTTTILPYRPEITCSNNSTTVKEYLKNETN